MSGSDDARAALAMEDFLLEDFNHVAQCGHEVRLVEARAHRLSQGRGRVRVCPSCDMLKILGELWTLELSAEHTVAVMENMIGTETDVTEDLGVAMENQDEEGWRNNLYVIVVSRFLNQSLYNFKHQVFHMGEEAIAEWETCWGQQWDLSALEVRYKTSGAHFLAEGASQVTVNVKIERRPGTPCTHSSQGLPDLGMPFPGTFFASFENTVRAARGVPVLTPIDD